MIGLLIYDEMGPQLSDGAERGYRAGVAAMVRLNKKKILKLGEVRGQRSLKFADLFSIAYSGSDERLLRNFAVEAFTVAGVSQYEAEERLKAMAKSIIGGTHPILQKNPEMDVKALWRDEAYNILADYIEVADMPPPAFLQTNLRTATASAYHAAQWQRLQGLTDIYPAYQYMTRDDDRVRDEHAALHGMVFQHNDPIWHRIWPPNGWNCRCYSTPLTSDELADVPAEKRVPLTDIERRQELSKGIVDPDFARNAGEAGSIWGKWLQQKFKDVDYNAKFKEVFDYSRSVGRYQEKGLLDAILEKNKTEFISKELTREAWEKEFPNNEVETPIGTAKLTGGKRWQSQFEKMLKKADERYKFFGLIKPTLKNPAMVIKDERGGIIFIRKFQGKTETIFFSLGYKDGELITILSNTPRSVVEAIKKLEKGEVLVLNASTLRGSGEPTRHSAVLSAGLKFDSNIANKSDDVNETWGEWTKPGTTVTRRIRYRVEGFEVSEVGNQKSEVRGYADIDEYRKGVLMR